jgi:hypothetical protein
VPNEPDEYDRTIAAKYRMCRVFGWQVATVCKQYSLGAAEALGALAIATAAAAPSRSTVWCIQSRGFGLALIGSLPIVLHVADDLVAVLAVEALAQLSLQRPARIRS